MEIRLTKGMRTALTWLGRVGSDDSETASERLQKSILVYFCVFTGMAGFVWGSLYMVSGAMLPGLNPMGYGAFSLLNLAVFARRRKRRRFQATQTFLMLVLPFVLQWSLGGFAAGSAVMMWALVAPIIALIVDGPDRAMPWFYAFLVLTAVSGAVDSRVALHAANMPHAIVTVFYVMTIGAMSSVVFLLLRHFSRQQDEAKRMSESLLLNILPPAIVERLKAQPGAIADSHGEVTVLFADIVGFTALSARSDPQELVRMLNGIFSDFDLIAERHGLEKIKTIGDAYMAAAGLPDPRDDHADAVMRAAVEMLAALQAHQSHDGEALDLRVGIHTGPVVAGVIGKHKFTYDLWGDTVNTASRMESHGVPGAIQISPATRKQLSGSYGLESRGPLFIKGKGEMATFLYRPGDDGRSAG